MPKITIAIDGFSSTGKSTIARQLGEWLDYLYVDTGAMYRAITLFAMRNNFISENHFEPEKLIATLPEIRISFKKTKTLGPAEVYLNDENVEKQIRSLMVSEFVSPIATISEVRKKLVEQQQLMGQGKGVVMDGRDIGTVVFPDADLKIFLDASAEKRANRRFKELQERGDDASFEEVLNNVQERDRIDSTREDSPLKMAVDAIRIDNSEMNLEDQFHIILQLAKDRIAGRI